MTINYETKVVYVFTSINGNEKAHGNPALVVFGDPEEREAFDIATKSRTLLNGEFIGSPIISFITPRNIEKNEFNIKYRFCNGTPMSICGHGTIGATKAIIDKYGIKGKNTFRFYLDQSFEDNKRFPYINIETDGNYFRAEFDEVNISKLEGNEITDIILKNLPNTKNSAIYKTENRDYICVYNSAEELRNIVIPKSELDKIRELDPTYRAILTTAVSDVKGYDYETTVFSDCLPAPVYKDPACGSANKFIPKLLRIENCFPDRFKNSDVETFKMFYPYRFVENGIKGGIQDVEYYLKKGKYLLIVVRYWVKIVI